MPFLGTIVNFLAIFLCGLIGSHIKSGIPKRINDGIMAAMSACVIYIGIDGALEAAPAVSEESFFSSGLVKLLIMILSMGIGTLIGELIDIDKWVNRLGDAIERKLSNKHSNGSFSRGFVACTLLFCIGAMAVNGSIQDAVGEPDVLLAKSVIDGIVCFTMAATLGVGCAFSAFSVLIYQGLLTLGGIFLASFLPEATISYMSIVGSLIIFFIGTNMLGLTKVKTANMIPAMFVPIAIAPLAALL
jgi:uncharacterized membrane protein YqgA involved in biofilm formation